MVKILIFRRESPFFAAVQSTFVKIHSLCHLIFIHLDFTLHPFFFTISLYSPIRNCKSNLRNIQFPCIVQQEKLNQTHAILTFCTFTRITAICFYLWSTIVAIVCYWPVYFSIVCKTTTCAMLHSIVEDWVDCETINGMANKKKRIYMCV